jgi:hypothetical protein
VLVPERGIGGEARARWRATMTGATFVLTEELPGRGAEGKRHARPNDTREERGCGARHQRGGQMGRPGA